MDTTTMSDNRWRRLPAPVPIDGACRVLIGSWVTPPTTGAIEIKRGGDENITINHIGGGDGGNNGGDGGGDGGDGGDGGGRESDGGVGGGRGDDSDER
jgi:hypothetical protein